MLNVDADSWYHVLERRKVKRATVVYENAEGPVTVGQVCLC